MKKERNNKGVTLIELIVLVAIMGIMLAVGGYSLSMIAAANAKSCAQEINAAILSTRAEAYSKDNGATLATMTLKTGSDGIYVHKSFDGEKKVGGSRVTVSYSSDGSVYTELDGTGIDFSFNRSSGAFDTLECKYIKVEGGIRSYTITCYKMTGKTVVE